jgi:AraC-like DNA-binding protein
MVRWKKWLEKDKIKMFRLFVSTYLIILLVAMLPVFVTVLNSFSILTKSREASAGNRLNNISKQMDREMARLYTNLGGLSSNSRLLEMSKIISQPNLQDIYTIFMTILELRKINSQFFDQINSIVYDLMLYYDASNQFINSETAYPDYFFYSNILNMNNPFRDALKMIESGVRNTVICQINSGENARAPSYYLFYRIALKRDNASGIIAILKFNYERLVQLSESADSGNLTLMLNQQNETVAYGNSVVFTDLPSFDTLPGRSGKKQLKIGGESYLVYWILSDFSEWKYASLYRKKEYSQDIDIVVRITIVYSSLFCVFAVIIAYLIFKRQYIYLDRMDKSLSNIFEEVKNGKGRLVEHLSGKVARLIDEHRQLSLRNKDVLDQMEMYKDRVITDEILLRNNFIFKIISGLTETESIEDQISNAGFGFDWDAFLVVIVDILECGSLVPDNSPKGWALVRHAIHSVVTDILNYNNLLCDISRDSVAILINFDSSDDHAEKSVQEFCNTLYRSLHNQFSVILSLAMGRPVYDWQEIPVSYKDALYMKDFMNSTGAVRMLWRGRSDQGIMNYNFPLELQMLLMRNLQKGDSKACQALLTQIFEDNRSGEGQNILSQNYLFFDIITTAARTLNTMKTDITDKIYKNGDWLNAFSTLKNSDDIKRNIMKFYENICITISKYYSGTSKKLLDIRRITDYLHNNYNDVNLTQTSIADHFGVTCSSLSLQFKKKQGINMMDYLHMLRVEKAKELLRTSDMKIVKITELVGFGNVKTFIRVFKNFTGLTPGIFRSGGYGKK